MYEPSMWTLSTHGGYNNNGVMLWMGLDNHTLSTMMYNIQTTGEPPAAASDSH